jgi:hypothetical protein
MVSPEMEVTRLNLEQEMSLLSTDLIIYLRFEVFTAGTMKNFIFWDVAPCRSCVNRRFVGTYRLHLQGRKILARGFSCLEDGGDTFLRNVGS